MRFGGPNAHYVTPFFDKQTAAGCVQVAIKFENLMLLYVVDLGKQADGTSDAQTSMHDVSSHLALDYVLPPPADDMVHVIGEQQNDKAVTNYQIARSLLKKCPVF